jgi:hypothetical protein
MYETEDNNLPVVGEPAAVYRHSNAETSPANGWNPNVPFCGTQEEWWSHFHRIEEGHFVSLEEHEKQFEAWKKEYLANRLK